MNSLIALSVSGLFVKYQGNTILKDINFSLGRGEFVGLLGPNGAGKTTLLHTITGFIRSYKGNVQILGKDVKALSSRERAKKISLLPQLVESPFFYSVKDIVLMGRYASSGNKDGNLDWHVDNALRICGILHLKNRAFSRLSGGEKRLVLLARCLCQDSPILLLDEATSSLDIRRKIEVFETLRQEACKNDRTILIVVHDINLASLYLDRLIFIKNGRIIKDGPVKEVLSERNLNDIYETRTRVIEHPEYDRPAVLFLPEKSY